MRGTGLRAVTTYPTISRQDKVSDFYFNCLCGTRHLLGGVQRPHVSDGQRRWWPAFALAERTTEASVGPW